MFNELKREIFVNNDQGFEKFCDMSIQLLNKYDPIKKKYKGGNQMPFVTKELSKTIMKRSKLRNNYLRKSKINYFTKLDEKKVSNIKLFWKVIKPSLSDKSCVKEQINLVEKGEILKTDLGDSRSFKYSLWKHRKIS